MNRFAIEQSEIELETKFASRLWSVVHDVGGFALGGPVARILRWRERTAWSAKPGPSSAEPGSARWPDEPRTRGPKGRAA